MSDDLRHRLGRAGEEAAAAHLARLGYAVIARNHRTRFCEVKTRRAGARVSPWDALGPGKQKRVRAMAAAWLAETADRPRSSELRFDAIGVVFDAHGALVALDHMEGAF